MMRIGRLLGYKETADLLQLAGISLLAMMVAAVALGAGSVALAQSSVAGEATVNNTEMQESPYQRWVDEDVRWIITPEERAAYLKLPTNKERLEFIHAFWQRRDPAAGGASKNVFRQEHYRRIAYANVHFVTAGDAGWKTDRGRIYIMYGRPDSIDAHTSGGAASAQPYEVWHYRAIQESGQAKSVSGYRAAAVTKKDVDMRFVDTCDCGDFVLQGEPQ